MNADEKLNVDGTLAVYPQDTDEHESLNKAETLCEFVKDSSAAKRRIASALTKHGKYDAEVYAELCKVFSEFADPWGIRVAGSVAHQVREALDTRDLAEYKGPVL